MGPDKVRAFSLDSHISIVESLNHRYSHIQKNVHEEHSAEYKSTPQHNVFVRALHLVKNCSVSRPDCNHVREKELVSIAGLGSESVENVGEGDYEEYEHNEEVSHRKHDLECVSDQVAYFFVDS